MANFYSNERNTQKLISLLKGHNIKRVIVSPGTTNVNFVGSIENDPFFELYSCVDERSAAYLACGMAAETNEPVVITCTAATASRNYLSGLTEAFYSKLPILAVTATQHTGKIGNNLPQVIDRTVQIKDTIRTSVHIPAVLSTEDDEWSANVLINKAILELTHNGGGPVHINLQTNYTTSSLSHPKIEDERIIKRVGYKDSMPYIEAGKIGIYVGAHREWSFEETEIVDKFCSRYNAVVLCDNTSNFWGEYRVQAQLASYQTRGSYEPSCFNLVIHIGNVSGSGIKINAKEVWRVNPDGEIRDTFRKLTKVFEMEEIDFFKHYVGNEKYNSHRELLDTWLSEYSRIERMIPEIPFSNIWIARNTIQKLPKNSVVHFGIWNSLMSWNYFCPAQGMLGYSNTGGFGIDGCLSSLIGASLIKPNAPYYGVFGDLAFFYDMNSIGNRHVSSNLRILMVNNGCGGQFHLSGNYSQRVGIPDAEVHEYIAAGGHFSNINPELTKMYVEALGFKYISAKTKKEYMENVSEFLSEKIGDKPIFFEVFVRYQDDAEAEDIIRSVDSTVSRGVRKMVKNVLGEESIQKVKKILKK